MVRDSEAHKTRRASFKLFSKGGKLGFEVRDLIAKLRDLLGEGFQATAG